MATPSKKRPFWKTILLSGLGIIVAFLGYVSMQPDEFRVSRSITIASPVDTIFPLINTQKQWQHWSPWATLDPHAIFTYEGPDEGVGARVRWKGNKNVGSGTSTIIDSRDDDYIKFRLEFVEPMASVSVSEFSFTSSVDPITTFDSTTVTWTMYGNQGFLSKLVSVFMDCETLIGDQFEQGLKNLKVVSEQADHF